MTTTTWLTRRRSPLAWAATVEPHSATNAATAVLIAALPPDDRGRVRPRCALLHAPLTGTPPAKDSAPTRLRCQGATFVCAIGALPLRQCAMGALPRRMRCVRKTSGTMQAV